MNEGVRPARPHEKLTEDGRRLREVLTYARRGSRFTPRQQAAWDAHHEAWVIPDEAVDRPGFALGGLVRPRGPADRRDRLGRGGGDRRAGRRPARRTTCWPSRSGGRAWPTAWAGSPRRARPTCGSARVDAVWSMEHLVDARQPGGALDLLPRPVAQEEAPQAPAGHPGVRRPRGRRGWRRAPSGGWRPTGPTTPSRWSRCSTPSRCCGGGVTDRWDERPVTKFERKGLAAGRSITDLAYPASRAEPEPGPLELVLDPKPLGVTLRPRRKHRPGCRGRPGRGRRRPAGRRRRG